MFDIGFQELVIIFVVALLVFGPKRLPEVSRTLGKWIGELRKGIYDARMQMDSEFEDVRKSTNQETGKEITREGTAGNGPEESGREDGGPGKSVLEKGSE